MTSDVVNTYSRKLADADPITAENILEWVNTVRLQVMMLFLSTLPDTGAHIHQAIMRVNLPLFTRLGTLIEADLLKRWID